MAALDLFGRRWALRVLWELHDGSVGFRALQQRCDDVSPTVLSTRLSELREAGIVEQDDSRAHRLTPLGTDLLDALAPLTDWAKRWSVGQKSRNVSMSAPSARSRSARSS